MSRLRKCFFITCWCVVVTLVGCRYGFSQINDGSVRGSVVDSLGARIPGATISLLHDGQRIGETKSDSRGVFEFYELASGRYQIEVVARGFEMVISDPVFISASAEFVLEIPLHVGPIEQHLTVTAAATDLLQARVGSFVTIIDQNTLRALEKSDVFELFRIVPGMQVVQTGQRGGTTAAFVRGGASDFNKVLIDGIPVNDIGGSFDFAALSTTAIERVEILRTSNSVLYGPDALSGVINITTRRGSTYQPELIYSIKAGNLKTLQHNLSVGGFIKRFDYFLDISRFDTDNNLPNNSFQNETLAGRFGWSFGNGTDLTFTVRRTEADHGLPGAIRFNGIPDDSSQTNQLTYMGLSARKQITDRWQGTAMFSSINRRYNFINPSPTGEPFDPFGFGSNYLGDQVHIKGANGFSAKGRAILDFSGSYPSSYKSNTTRQSIFSQTNYRIADALNVSAGFRFEHENGISGLSASTERTNVGSFVELAGDIRHRFHLIGGVGFDYNELFGYEVTPRLSVAAYLRRSSISSEARFDDIKLTFNFGKGIKAPSVLDEQSSLLNLLKFSPTGNDLTRTFSVQPIGPERSRTMDVGVEQGLLNGRVRVRMSFFHNKFTDLIEYVSSTVLPRLGVSPAVVIASGFGAAVNSASYRARGIEASSEIVFGDSARIVTSYTFLDAIVTESFSSSALSPTINSNFPGIEIGAFSPLVGLRPFRRSKHSGSLLINYADGPVNISLVGYFTGKQDDSTFLSDRFFGNSLLLPNADLNGGYQKVDLSGSYRITPRLLWHANLENILNQQYEAVFGFPALPLTFMTGLKITLAGPH